MTSLTNGLTIWQKWHMPRAPRFRGTPRFLIAQFFVLHFLSSNRWAPKARGPRNAPQKVPGPQKVRGPQKARAPKKCQALKKCEVPKKRGPPKSARPLKSARSPKSAGPQKARGFSKLQSN